MSICETRFGRLTAHFFAGFLENDLLMTADTGMQSALAHAVGLIAVPSVFYCLFAIFKYATVYYPTREVLTWPDKVLFLSCTMILTGLVTVVEWDALFLDRRDYQILVPLPLTVRLLFFAKLAAVILLLVIFWAAANLGAALLFPAVVLTMNQSSVDYARYVGAHVLTTFAASAFVFLLLTGTQGVLLNLLNPKWFRRASVYVQLVVALVLVFAFLSTPRMLLSVVDWVRGDSRWLHVLPPLWFFGLYEVLLGSRNPQFGQLADLAVEVLVGSAMMAAIAYAASYRRHAAKALESLEPKRSGSGFGARGATRVFDRFILSHPLERACFHFVRLTLSRSRLHRLLLATSVGVGFALVLGEATLLLERSPRPTPAFLSVQLVLSFFALSGMRFAFTIPAELRANWAFQAAEPEESGRCRSGVRKAMLVFGVCPVLLGLLPFHVLIWGWPVAAVHLLYGALLSAMLAEALLFRFEKIPFTCSYLPGKANLKLLWPVYLMAYTTYAYTMSAVECRLLTHPGLFVIFVVVGAAVLLVLARYGKRQFGPEFRFLFDDQPEPAVRTLEIGR